MILPDILSNWKSVLQKVLYRLMLHYYTRKCTFEYARGTKYFSMKDAFLSSFFLVKTYSQIKLTNWSNSWVSLCTLYYFNYRTCFAVFLVNWQKWSHVHVSCMAHLLAWCHFESIPEGVQSGNEIKERILHAHFTLQSQWVKTCVCIQSVTVYSENLSPYICILCVPGDQDCFQVRELHMCTV